MIACVNLVDGSICDVDNTVIVEFPDHWETPDDLELALKEYNTVRTGTGDIEIHQFTEQDIAELNQELEENN